MLGCFSARRGDDQSWVGKSVSGNAFLRTHEEERRRRSSPTPGSTRTRSGRRSAGSRSGLLCEQKTRTCESREGLPLRPMKLLRMPFFSFSSVIDVSGAGVDGRLIVLLAVDALG